jgi:excisionase family DNA binding protein
MTPKELAAFLQVPVKTIYAWRYTGDGPPGFRIGKHLRFDRRDVIDWLDRRRDPRGGV